jgi:hypothetical protein
MISWSLPGHREGCVCLCLETGEHRGEEQGDDPHGLEPPKQALWKATPPLPQPHTHHPHNLPSPNKCHNNGLVLMFDSVHVHCINWNMNFLHLQQKSMPIKTCRKEPTTLMRPSFCPKHNTQYSPKQGNTENPPDQAIPPQLAPWQASSMVHSRTSREIHHNNSFKVHWC